MAVAPRNRKREKGKRNTRAGPTEATANQDNTTQNTLRSNLLRWIFADPAPRRAMVLDKAAVCPSYQGNWQASKSVIHCENHKGKRASAHAAFFLQGKLQQNVISATKVAGRYLRTVPQTLQLA